MSELSPDAEDLISRASGGDDPSALDERRIRTKLAVRLAAAAAAAGAVATAPAQALPASSVAAQTTTGAASLVATGAVGSVVPAASAKAGLALSSKLVLALALSGGGAALGVQYFSGEAADNAASERTAPTTFDHAAQSQAAQNRAAQSRAAQSQAAQNRAAQGEGAQDQNGLNRTAEERPSAERSAAPHDPGGSPVEEELHRDATESGSVRRATGGKATNEVVSARVSPATAPPSSIPAAGSVAEEASLLRQARVALANGSTIEAARLLAQHKSLFPQGALVEERIATQVMAECAKGRSPKTARRAAEFLSAYPLSPLANSVRKACSRNEPANDSLTDP